jgi:hypothetical protein
MIYRGIIENNDSPEKDGRVQVRIFGIHDTDKNIVKTEDLPWAEVEQTMAFGFSSGVGFSSIPNIGTWVFVRLDHENPNYPIVTSAISGKSTEKSDYKFPLEDRLNEEDQNRLQRVQELDKTIHKSINTTRDNASENATAPTNQWKDSVSGADVTSFEPISLSDKAKYPDNVVIETKSGHVIEIDDTPGNERIRMYHRSGTYTDYRPDGSVVDKITKNMNKIIDGYLETHIKQGVKEYIEKNLDQIITGGSRQNVKMDKFQHIAGFFKITADGNLEINNDVKITKSLEVIKKITAGSNITSKAEVADSKGNLSSLRKQHDANVSVYNAHAHTGNDGHPTSPPLSPETKDPKARTNDFTWSNNPKGFAQ